MKKLTLFAIGSILCGCSGSGGGSGSPATSYPHNAFAVTLESDLPPCSGDIVGRLYYIETTDIFKVCKAAGWTTIDVGGSDGVSITSVTSCSKLETNRYEFKIVTYSTGTKFVFCSVSDSATTSSSSGTFLTGQAGATSEGCIVTHDIDTAGSGFFHFENNSGARTATYYDVGSASNGLVISFDSTTNCSTAVP